MEIVFAPGRAPELVDPQLLNAFAVRVVEPYPGEELAVAVWSVGVLAEGGEHVFVERDWIRHAAESLPIEPDWPERFAKMLVYADSHGWVDGAGRIRAHIVRVAAEPSEPA